MGNHSSKKKISMCSSDDLTTRSKEISCLSNGVQVRAVSFEALKRLTESLLATNQEVAEVISNIKEDVSKNKEFNELVKDCFHNYWDTSQFCCYLQGMQNTREAQDKLLATMERIECKGKIGGHIRYKETFKETTFNEELLRNLKSLSERQSQMKTKLERHNEMISKKYKSLHAWRRNATAIFVGTCAGVVVCAIVAAALAVPPVAAALSVATTIPLGSVGKWINGLWKKYETALKDHQKVSYAMEEVAGIATRDLKSIQELIENLKADDQGVLH